MRSHQSVGLRGVTRRFGATTALDDLNLQVRPGEVLALVGENGSGKSTACKLMAGIMQPDAGSVEIDGAPVTLRNPAAARDLGIALVHQEFSLVPQMSVARNLMLGQEPAYFTDQQINREAQDRLARLGFGLEPSTPVAALGSAQKQMVEIAKAVGGRATTILFDEPTATLTPEEKRQLFHLITRLRSDGFGIALVTHVLEEALEHADRIAILRDGRLQVEDHASALDRDAIIRHMVGRDVQFRRFRAARPAQAAPDITVRAVAAGQLVSSMTFSARPGEVVGIAGLVGAGRTESALVIAGATKRRRLGGGAIKVRGRELRVRTPRGAVRRGIGYVTEDRKLDGFFETMNVEENIHLGWLARYGRFGISRRTARRLRDTHAERFEIRGDLAGTVKQLSGGNQQKVVIAKTLAQDPRIVILDEPTRGVDVGAIEAIHQQIRDLADAGTAVVVISSYLPEIVAISDRVLVAQAGRIVAEFDPDEATEDDILFAAVH